MNIEKYTDRARGFVQSAQSLAQREGHQQFAPEHLLKVLLDDPEGLAAGLIDRYLFYVAPKLLGGGSAPGVLEGWSAATIGEARPLVLRGTRRMGEDLRLEARPREGAV